MGKWLIGIAGTVIGGVLVWWLTEGVARYGNLPAPPSYSAPATEDIRRPTSEPPRAWSRVRDREYVDIERPVRLHPRRDVDDRYADRYAEDDERLRAFRERQWYRERELMRKALEKINQ
jgi:hypothetical protein